MTETLFLDKQSTALLLMDFQSTIVEGFATDRDVLLDRTRKLLSAARSGGITIVHVVVGFRPGYPEVSERNLIFSILKNSARFAHASAGTEIHSAVAPRADEIIVTKHRVGAFLGTDLDQILRANNIHTLLLSGISTSGVVLSTLRYAADADYGLIVVRDCCSDPDEEVHRVLMDKVFARQAKVVSSETVLAALGA